MKPFMTDDAELLRRYAEERSEPAFAELVSRHLGFVYAAALRQLGGSVHRAEEVTQTVFIDLARKAAILAGRAEIVGWLYTSTHYAAAKLKRGEQRRQSREQEAHAMNEILADNPAAADWDRLRPVLDDATLELGESDREVILLRFFRGRRFSEVGRTLGLSEDAARMRADRALEKLRVLLARREITSTTAALGLVLANQPAVALPATLAAGVTGAALAGATAGAGMGGFATAAAFFMNTKITLVTAVAVLAIGFSIYEFNTLRREQEAAVRARAELQAQVLAAQQRAITAERQSADLRTELETTRQAKSALLGFKPTLAVAPAAAPAPTPTLSVAPADAGGLRFSLGSPMTREQIRTNNGQNLDAAYAALYRELNLTPAQREQFKNLMLDTEEANKQLFGKAVTEARARNPNFDRADQYEIAQAVWAQTQLDQQAAVRQAMGESTAQALQNYQATGSMRVIVKQLAGNLFNSDAPLLPAQADQLIEIMARNARGSDGKVELVALDVEAAVAQAGNLLSPAQLVELRNAANYAVMQAKAERERNTAPMATLKAAGK